MVYCSYSALERVKREETRKKNEGGRNENHSGRASIERIHVTNRVCILFGYKGLRM